MAGNGFPTASTPIPAEKVLRTRDGTDHWSEASSLDGNVCGRHYEREVRLRLTFEREKQEIAKRSGQLPENVREGLKSLYQYAHTVTQHCVSPDLYRRISKRFEMPQFSHGQVEADVVIEEGVNLKEKLGCAAQILHGPVTTNGLTVCEVSVMSALAIIKCAQLEHFLQMCAATGRDQPSHCVLVLNRKPFELDILNALTHFPLLKGYVDRNKFSVVHLPHSFTLHQHEQVIEQIEQKDHVIEQKDHVIEQKDRVIALLLFLIVVGSFSTLLCMSRGSFGKGFPEF